MGVLVIGLVLFLGAHVFVTLRGPRAAVIARIGEWPYKGLMSVVALAGLVLIGYGFGHYRATGWVQSLVSATMDALRRPAADVAGQHLRGRGLLPGPDLAHAQAPHAGRGEDLGGRASHFERRSRFDRAVRLCSRLGGL
jgi:hypothetical protein